MRLCNRASGNLKIHGGKIIPIFPNDEQNYGYYVLTMMTGKREGRKGGGASKIIVCKYYNNVSVLAH